MEIRHGLAGLRSTPKGAVLSIGNFDGLHIGHRSLLALAASLRARPGANGNTGGRMAIVTFEPHPLTVLRPELAPPRLTPPAVKQAMLEAAGVDDYIVLPPAPDVLNLSAEDFWSVLRDDVRPTHLIEGNSFNFGKARRGTIDLLRDWSAGSGIELHIVEAVEVALLDLTIAPVSSSLIRWLLAHGRVRDAAICLGRSYALRGKVVKGFQRGRTIGVPTANMKCDDRLVPSDGVYAGRCAINGTTYPAAVSIGSLPTFEERKFQVEAHLIGFDGDLYDATIEIELIDWLREQCKFTGISALKQQLARDLHHVEERWNVRDRENDQILMANARPQ